MLKVKDFNKFQHFKDRRPPWIKLYRDLLDDVEWHSLDPKAAKALVMIWLIASEDKSLEGNLPELKTLAFRLRLPVSETSQILRALSHWLEGNDNNLSSRRYQTDDSLSQNYSATETGRYQVDTPEAEAEKETEAAAEQRQSKSACLPAAAELHKSRFSFSEVEEFVLATKRHATNPGGLARKLWRTGEEDDRIAEFLGEREEADQLQEQLKAASARSAADFSMDDWVTDLITNDWRDQLQNELDQITERGGPTADWEHRVIAYFNQSTATNKAA